MSTEAPHSPIPPRPAAPPRPATPPASAVPHSVAPAPAVPHSADAADEAAEPPPVPSARFPDVRPPVDQDWVLGRPRPTPARHDEDPDQAARIQDLLAPFEEARPRPQRSTPTAPPRLPDAPPTVAAESRTPAPVESAAPPADEDVSRTPRNASGKTPPLPARAPGTPSIDDGTPHTQGDAPPPPPSSARLADASPLDGGASRARSEVSAEPRTPPLPAFPARLADASAPGDGASRTSGDVADDAPPPPSSARLPDEPPVVVGKVGTDAVLDGGVSGAGGELGSGAGGGRPFVFLARPAVGDDRPARLRPVAAWVRPRAAAAAACAVLGLGLIGGAVTGSWLTGESAAGGAARSAYTVTGALWHSVPVDRLFPPELEGEGAGPGGADRAWTRIAVAPDSGCRGAFDPLLKKALDPVGCLRLLRATYTDATRSHVTTVGLLFTKADADAMQTLRNRFTEEGLDRRTDLMPRPYAAKGTACEGFGDAQRAAWTVSVLPDAPVVAYSVSGFADGRAVTDPAPATEAMGSNTTSAPAQAGLGHEAKGIADRVERGLRKIIAAAEKAA
ncbi:hypothetical protein AB0H82_17660 [Streptomyces sp. NPDC050732]|uniref:hypothetical protein n=1 Tax=Streptomyces sp. NPDC050732 TaxID=3154632 RepID=UPI00343E01BF